MGYTDVFNIDKAICPYCKQPSILKPLTPSKRYEIECDECSHRYYVKRDAGSFDACGITYHTAPDCTLNGYEHDIITKTSKGQDYSFCAVCDMEA